MNEHLINKRQENLYGKQCIICNKRTNKDRSAKYCKDCEKDINYLTRYKTIGMTALKARHIAKYFRKKFKEALYADD